MEVKDIIDVATQAGTLLTVATIAGYALWKQTSFIMRENSKREERLAIIIENNLKGIHDLLLAHDQRSSVWMTAITTESDRRQQEHVKMLEALTAITFAVSSK